MRKQHLVLPRPRDCRCRADRGLRRVGSWTANSSHSLRDALAPQRDSLNLNPSPARYRRRRGPGAGDLAVAIDLAAAGFGTCKCKYLGLGRGRPREDSWQY
jgi:hypothetical protein